MNELSDAEVLRKAVDVLAERGWHQGGYEGRDGSVCVLGAIDLAEGIEIDSADTISPAVARFSMTLGDDYGVYGIPGWNDAPERTYEDVVLALKVAASEAEAL